MGGDTWTQERVGILTEMWVQGRSAAAIADSLGVTRNMVIGKAHRIGLPSRPTPGGQNHVG